MKCAWVDENKSLFRIKNHLQITKEKEGNLSIDQLKTNLAIKKTRK